MFSREILINNFNISSYFFDSSLVSYFKVNFQESSTVFMEVLIDLHHEIMFILILLLCGVLFLLIDIVKSFAFTQKTVDNTRMSVNITYSSWLEGLWTIFPLVILYLLTGPVFAFMYMMESVELLGVSSTDINLKVIGNQWYWDYSYDCEFYLKTCLFFFDLVDANKKDFWKVILDRRIINFESYMLDSADLVLGSFRLLEVDRVIVLPKSRLINLWITSKDVLHSWAVPSMGVKIDACPGRANFVNLFINRLGRFYGQCSEICGIKHGFMPISIDVCYYKDFVKWFYANSESYYKFEGVSKNVQKIFFETFNKNI